MPGPNLLPRIEERLKSAAERIAPRDVAALGEIARGAGKRAIGQIAGASAFTRNDVLKVENHAGDPLRGAAIFAASVSAPLDFTTHRSLRCGFVPRDVPALAPPPGLRRGSKCAPVLKHQLFRTTHQSHQFPAFCNRECAFRIFRHQLIETHLFFGIEIFHRPRVTTLFDSTTRDW